MANPPHPSLEGPPARKDGLLEMSEKIGSIYE